MHDTCPRCGYRKEPYMMSQRSDSTLREMWDGKDGAFIAGVMRAAVLFILFLAMLLLFSL